MTKKNAEALRMIHRLLLILLVCFTCHSVNGQKRLSIEGLKINLNYIKNVPDDGHTIGNLAPVFIIRNKRENFHEAELNTFDVNSGKRSLYDQGGNLVQVMDTRFLSVGMRYQFTWNIIKKENQKVVPQVGLSFLSLYRSTFYDPQLQNSFKRRVREFHEYIGIVPQVRYNMSKKVFVDLALPLEFIESQFTAVRVYNEALPVKQQKNGWRETNYRNFNTLLKYSHIRLGVGVKF